jgi:hypothetical protein
MSDAVIGKVNGGVALAQQGVFTTIFGFFTTASGKDILMESKDIFHHSLPLQVVIFPLAALLELIELTSSVTRMATTKNRNLEKTMDLTVTSIKTITVMTAIIIGTLATITASAAPVIVPILFTAAMALSASYSIANTIYHLIGMKRAQKDSLLYQAHCQAMKKNLIKSVVGVMLTGVIVGLFVVGVSTGVGLAVISAVGIAAMITAVVVPRVLKWRASRKVADSKDITKISHSGDDENKTDRLYVRNLHGKLEAAHDKKQELFGIIDEKAARLKKEMNDKVGFFATSQRPKRTMKREGLLALKKLLEPSKKPSKEEIDEISDNYPGIFQSFFRDKSDVENIFDVAKEFFAVDECPKQGTGKNESSV